MNASTQGLLTVIFASLLASAQGSECFRIIIPKGINEIRVPTNLSLIRFAGQSRMTPAGFWLYHSGQNLALSGPAIFCLDQDVVRDVGLAALLGEPGGFGPLVTLSNSDIVLDLNGHNLRSDRAGVAIDGYMGGKIHQPLEHNFTFQNGTINVRGKGVALTGWQYTGSPHNYHPGPEQIKLATERYGPNFREFGGTNILLENLTIKSGGLAAYLVGRNNIIRHCHIEVEGHEAVALFGANNQLIDNEIVVKRSLSPPTPKESTSPVLGTYYPQYAAIWIRDAPGLIIRGNTITIEGLLDAQQAIQLINSPDLVIENNEVTGADKLYTALDTQSSVHARNNRKRFGKWPDN